MTVESLSILECKTCRFAVCMQTCRATALTSMLPAQLKQHAMVVTLTTGSMNGKCSSSTHPSNLPANPHHQRAKEVARKVLNDRKWGHKDDKHHCSYDKAIDAGVDPSPHGEDGLREDVAACEASTSQGCGHIGPACTATDRSQDKGGVSLRSCVQQTQHIRSK